MGEVNNRLPEELDSLYHFCKKRGQSDQAIAGSAGSCEGRLVAWTKNTAEKNYREEDEGWEVRLAGGRINRYVSGWA